MSQIKSVVFEENMLCQSGGKLKTTPTLVQFLRKLPSPKSTKSAKTLRAEYRLQLEGKYFASQK